MSIDAKVKDCCADIASAKTLDELSAVAVVVTRTFCPLPIVETAVYEFLRERIVRRAKALLSDIAIDAANDPVAPAAQTCPLT